MFLTGTYYCIALIAAVCFCGLLTHKIGGVAFYGPIFLLLVFFAGARASWVGTDAAAYVLGYRNFQGIEEVGERLTDTESGEIEVKSVFTEWGFTLLQAAAQLVSNEYWALFTLVAVVCVSSHLLSFHSLSENVLISVYILLTTTWYFFFFNGFRQGVALAVYTLSFNALLKRDLKMYIFWVVLAMTFHRSAFFALPVYFLFTKPNTTKVNILIFLFGLFCVFFLRNLIGIAAETVSEKYAIYATGYDTSGKNYAAFYMFLAIFFLLCKQYIPLEDRFEYDTFLNMVLFGGVLNIAVAFGNGASDLMRMSIYFIVGVCYLWPILLRNVRSLVLPFVSMQFLFFLYMSRKTTAIKYYSFNEWIAPILGPWK